jgi:hypothetical protein
MLRIRSFVTFALLAAGAAALGACGSDGPATTDASLQSTFPVPFERPANTRIVRADTLVGKLEAAGLRVTETAAAPIDRSVRDLLSEEPRSRVTLRIEDAQGRSCRMTFLEFASWMPPAELDARPVDGFSARNWFVQGDAPTYFVVRVREALGR